MMGYDERSRDTAAQAWVEGKALAAALAGASNQPRPANSPMSEVGYELLADVLLRAYNQAALGKGKERHANNKPFDQQPMQDLIRLHGVGFATGQSGKKASEALNLPPGRDVAELLGAIVYLAGAVIALERAALSKVS